MTLPINNRQASLWLITDMCLILTALTLVKTMGIELAASQLVWVRALTGLSTVLPWALMQRRLFHDVQQLPLHALRIALAAITLTASFFAISRIPLALFTAVNFSRPILLMIMAALILHEHISLQRWLIAIVGLVGVFVAINLDGIVWSWGVPAMLVTVCVGSAAIIVTRQLKSTPPLVMMVFYTAGLSVIVAPLAWWQWQPVREDFWPPLLAIGVISQVAQFCFLKAHQLGEVGVLGPLGYVSLLLSASVGYLVFNEVPSLAMIAGAVIIMGSLLALSWTR